MKRLGIFVFYDLFGVVDDYKKVLLVSLNEILDRLIIVCNGLLSEDGYDCFKKITKEIYLRDNEGYDAAAYRYVMLNVLGRKECERYDEIVMLNDTFYGPFSDWKVIFNQMRKRGNDFWGLAKGQEGGREFIQSYFRVFGKRLIQSDFFWREWGNLELCKTYKECVIKFERGISWDIEENGYRCESWLDVNGGKQLQGKNVYREYSYRTLIGEYDFPVVKCKSLSVTNYNNTVESFDYIKNHTKYDINLILKHQERLDDNCLISPYSEREVKEFLNTHAKIYIYGHGLLANGLAEYFEAYGRNIEGFVVTKKKCPESTDIELDDLVLEDEDGVILAVGNILAPEIKTLLVSRFKEKQMLLPR